MDITETIIEIQLQLEQIEQQEIANGQEQANVNLRLLELEKEQSQQQQRRNQLDQEALRLYTKAEDLRTQLSKLKRIASLSQEFLQLHAECRDNQDLLNTLYSCVSAKMLQEEVQHPDISLDPFQVSTVEEESIELELSQTQPNETDANYFITIDQIKKTLPNAEKIYQQLVAGYLEEYKTYQNYIVDGLDLIWYSVAFIAFGRTAYRKMSFKYHPDLDGSERAMQLINTAWSIAQNFVANPPTSTIIINTL
ncbi:hypothetical protein NIES4102_04150 [Chondrocystis sp. NIES-4102]|nr:hypothetical protein NIES4102_04150 [Chondrocystis sp. NIES-4102]